ncbi:MAG: Ig-like domain-containing protein [Candidatus Thiothrix putei]|uniref:Ig-like domain-containing protein n=1 Tax=Candidatus Thiothrix putei TaxID=3080811 RepID=A0AA95HDP5_9GAMM|nr:MAG: Ig-like domain-containing protein [Candidatus Thiothrix putei]
MNNKKILSPKWAILPLLFCSAAVLAGDGGHDGSYGNIPLPPAAALTLEDNAAAPVPVPDSMAQAQALGQESDGFLEDSTETSTVNTGYVGGNTRIGVGIDTELKGKAEASQVIHENGSSATIGQGYVGFNPNADKDAGEESLTGAGAKLSHHWVSGDANNPSRVNKIFGAYDQNEQEDKKATLGYGQENASLFWSGHVSKGLSEGRATTTPGVTEKAYDLGVGGRVGTFLPEQQMRVQGGLDYEWGKDFSASEKRPTQTTLTGGVEKFFPDTPHSVGAEVEVYKKAGGAMVSEDAEARGGISYRYDIGSEAGVWQPEQRYRRIRTEIPGEQIKQPPKIERKLVKNTMELESDTFFKLDSAKLTPEAQERMKAVMGQIRASGHEGNIRITGNTCDKGSDAHNQSLSERRANAVRDFMVKNGFSADELQARGLGESQPKYPNTEAEGHKNRRVDIEYVTYQNEYKDEVIEQGGTSTSDPKVVWRKELIPEPPLWVRQALRNTADHKQTVDTYKTTAGSANGGNGGNTPVAVNDNATTTAETPVAIDVLTNDTDPNGDPLSIASFAQGTNGAVTQVGNMLVYTPVAGFTGTDQFTYIVKDPGNNQSQATVTVTVGGAANPNAPIANTDQVETIRDVAVTIPVLDNDRDPNGDPLSVTGTGAATNGTVTQSGNNVTYTPNPGFTGDDRFTYTVTDGNGNTVTGDVFVRVNTPGGNLNAQADLYTVDMNSSDNVFAVMSNDEVPAGGATLTIVNAPGHGSASVSGNQIVYTPTIGYSGVDELTYRLTDDRGFTTETTVDITISGTTTPGNLAPTGDYLLIDLNDTTTKTLAVLDNDTGDEMTIIAVSTPQYGTARISADGKSILFTLRHGYCADHEFTYIVKDKYGNQAQATVTVDVAPANIKDPNSPPA